MCNWESQERGCNGDYDQSGITSSVLDPRSDTQRYSLGNTRSAKHSSCQLHLFRFWDSRTLALTVQIHGNHIQCSYVLTPTTHLQCSGPKPSTLSPEPK